VTRHPPAHAAKLAQDARRAAPHVVVVDGRRERRQQRRRRGGRHWRRRRRRRRAVDERVELREHRVGREQWRRLLELFFRRRLLGPGRLGRPVDQEVELREDRVVEYALHRAVCVRVF